MSLYGSIAIDHLTNNETSSNDSFSICQPNFWSTGYWRQQNGLYLREQEQQGISPIKGLFCIEELHP
jgi:hypothetical protein